MFGCKNNYKKAVAAEIADLLMSGEIIILNVFSMIIL
jgi:hypothetical protein